MKEKGIFLPFGAYCIWGGPPTWLLDITCSVPGGQGPRLPHYCVWLVIVIRLMLSDPWFKIIFLKYTWEKVLIAINPAHLSSRHCEWFAAAEGLTDPTLYPWQMENALLPAWLSVAHSSRWLDGSHLREGLICDAHKHPSCWRHWAAAHGEGERREPVMMSWWGRGLVYPAQVMKQGAQNHPDGLVTV